MCPEARVLKFDRVVMKVSSKMAEKSPKGSTGCSLPLSRVKTIMKSSPEVSNIGQDSLFMIAKSAVSKSEENRLKWAVNS